MEQKYASDELSQKYEEHSEIQDLYYEPSFAEPTKSDLAGAIEEDTPAEPDETEEVVEPKTTRPQVVKKDDKTSKIWQYQLEYSKKKIDGELVSKIKPSLTNLVLILENDSGLKGIIGINSFADDLKLKASAPWRQCSDKRNGDLWNDADDAELQHYVAANHKVEFPETKWRSAVIKVANKNAFNPVKDTLDELVWDGVERLDTMMVKCFGVEDTGYTRAATRKWMAAAVARVYEPGCKFDYLIVLEGAQGYSKSSFGSIIALHPNDFTDCLDITSIKNTVESIQSAHIVEAPELTSLNKKSIDDVKSFASRQKDRARLSYRRNPDDYFRTCVFFGTTNNDRYLKDETGNRRFWPLKITRPLDREFIGKIKLQLWAEAKHRYKEGEKLWMSDQVLLEAAEAEQAKRMDEDPLVGQIVAHIDSDRTSLDKICVPQVWKEVLNESGTIPRPMSNGIHSALRQINGWRYEQKAKRFGPYGPQRGYFRIKPEEYGDFEDQEA